MKREIVFALFVALAVSCLGGCASFRTPRENSRADVISCTKDMLGYVSDGELAFKMCNTVQKEY